MTTPVPAGSTRWYSWGDNGAAHASYTFTGDAGTLTIYLACGGSIVGGPGNPVTVSGTSFKIFLDNSAGMSAATQVVVT